MTKLIFLMKNIFQFFITEKTLTMLILLGMVICDTIFLVFGNVFWSDTKSNEYRIYENNVVVLQFDTLDIDEFLNRISEKDYIKTTSFKHTIYNGSNFPLAIAAYFPMLDIPNSRIKVGHGLKDDNTMEFIMSDYYALNRNIYNLPLIKLNDMLYFINNDWKCNGIVRVSEADNFDVLISLSNFKSYIDNNITVSFRFTDGTSLIEIQNFSNNLKVEFNAYSVVTPSKTVYMSFSEFLHNISSMIILLIIAIINYMFLYRFLMIRRTYTYGIFKLYGMNNLLMVIELCFEMFIFLIISYSFSFAFYLAGISLFTQFDSVFEHVTEFVFAFIIIVALNFIFFAITTVKFIKSTPIELLRESVVT